LKQELTDRQASVLAYIKKYITKFGYAPSIRAIAERFDMTVNGGAGHVKALEAKGYIKRTKGLARAMVVLE
jgi:repressor LexA